MTRKARTTMDLPPDLLAALDAEAARRGISRNEMLADIIRDALGREEYRCPFCGTVCVPGEGGCEHFDPQDVTWGRE